VSACDAGITLAGHRRLLLIVYRVSLVLQNIRFERNAVNYIDGRLYERLVYVDVIDRVIRAMRNLRYCDRVCLLLPKLQYMYSLLGAL